MEKKTEGPGDEECWRWRSEEQVEEELLVEEQQGRPGLGGQRIAPMTGERGVKVGGWMKEEDWIRTVERGGWEVGSLKSGLGSEGAGVRVEPRGEGCCRGIPHWIPPSLLQGAVNERVRESWRGRGRGRASVSERGPGPRGRGLTPGGTSAHRS